MGIDDRIAWAREVYGRTVSGGDTGEPADTERGLDAVEADTALARGLILHARDTTCWLFGGVTLNLNTGNLGSN